MAVLTQNDKNYIPANVSPHFVDKYAVNSTNE